MGIGKTKAAVPDEDMARYVTTTRSKFSQDSITLMYQSFHEMAPEGEMRAEQFKKYLDSLCLNKNLGEVMRVDTEAQAIRLFRGYDLNGDGGITFDEFLLYQEAVLFKTERLVQILFSILDRNHDGRICKDDIVCILQGTESPEIDSTFQVVDTEIQGVWQFFNPQGHLYITNDKFTKGCEICPEIVQGLLDLV